MLTLMEFCPSTDRNLQGSSASAQPSSALPARVVSEEKQKKEKKVKLGGNLILDRVTGGDVKLNLFRQVARRNEKHK
jgi:hypothetical protein